MHRILLITALLVTVGCASVPRFLHGGNLGYVFDSIARDLCPSSDNVCTSSPIIVTDFTNIALMKPGPKGLLFSDYMKASLSKVCHCEIYEVKLRKTLKLSESGLEVLTENATQLRRKEYNTRWMVIGTYKETPYSTVIFVRLVDLATGKIKRFTEREIYY